METGAAHDKAKQYSQASAAYAQALKHDPENQAIYFKYGWSQYKAGNLFDGLQKMKEAIEKGVNDAQSLGKLGEILMREGPDQDLVLAEKYLRSSIEQDDKNAETLVWLGRVCEKQAKMDEARTLFQKAVDLPNCTMVDAYFYLGVICEKQKDYKKAILHLKTCL